MSAWEGFPDPDDGTDGARCECGRFVPCRHCPTPIDPADIRPGDVWEMRRRVNVQSVSLDDPELFWDELGNPWRRRDNWHLIHRPDPDEEVEDLIGRDGLAALRERGFDVVRRAES